MLEVTRVTPCATAVIHLDGRLRAPLDGRLRRDVAALLARGERRILLNLSRVADVDAAGVGELVRSYNMSVAARGSLRIAAARSRVRTVLERVGLLDLLTSERGCSLTDAFRAQMAAALCGGRAVRAAAGRSA